METPDFFFFSRLSKDSLYIKFQTRLLIVFWKAAFTDSLTVFLNFFLPFLQLADEWFWCGLLTFGLSEEMSDFFLIEWNKMELPEFHQGATFFCIPAE